MNKINTISIATYGVLIFFSFFPLFFNLPFRIHLDLPYEGAFRISHGQIPFRDFTMPLGYGFLIFPTLCFWLFGSYLKSLLISQVIISLLVGFSFIGILKNLKLTDAQVFIAVLVLCLSYNFIYFWPWYNNTAFAFQLVGIYFLTTAFNSEVFYKKLFLTLVAAFFIALTFLTKQDYGGLAFIFGLILCAYIALVKKDYSFIIVYLVAYAAILTILIYPFLQYDFLYWFNLGKPPHENRLKLYDILNELFANSEWEKFYLLVVLIVVINKFQKIKKYVSEPKNLLFLLICLGFIFEALITKVTSKQSIGNTTYFHAFAIAFILSNVKLKFELNKAYFLIPICLFVSLWWSGMFWKYANRIFKAPANTIVNNRNVGEDQIVWELSEFKTMEKVKLPTSTIEGIKRLKAIDIDKATPNPNILNLTELTMLAEELNFMPMKGLPLWYHLHVGIFQHQVDSICSGIEQNRYDLVLFEEIPSLENFFPEQIRDALKSNYDLKDSFLAPRKEGDSFIEVYTPKQLNK